MQLFVSDFSPSDSLVQLSPEESYHAAQVLRMRIGELIHLTDGKGNLVKGELVQVDAKKTQVSILEVIPQVIKNSHLHIAIAPTKNIDRFEWFLEKATEIGVAEITPLLCRFSERKEIKLERLNKVIVAAAKQSHHFTFPILNPLTKMDQFVKSMQFENKFIAHCEPTLRNDFSQSVQSLNKVLVIIGPEGDFSEQEIELALQHSFKPVSLGNYRLRTETAGVYACAAFNAMHP